MEISTTLYSTTLLLGAAHGIFLALALITVKSGNIAALRLLALLTLTFAIDLAVNYLRVAGYLAEWPRLAFIESAGTFLYGPFLYFYVVALTSRKEWRWSARRWLHFLPFVAGVALLVPFLGLSDEILVDRIYADADVTEALGALAWGGDVVDVLPRLLIGIYLLMSIRRLLQHGRHIRDHFSLIEHISLNWLRNLLIAFGVIYGLYLVALAFGGKGPVESLLNVAIVVIIYTLGYLGLRQPIIFTQRDQGARADSRGPADSPAAAHPAKYRKSALDDESSRMLLNELQELMKSEQPYLDSKLTLAQLADRLGISSNYLSQVINQQTGSNFFDYINGHRVAAAKEILADPARADHNVLTVAMDSGFNSKSAFYTAFKHHANMTPSQYRQEKLS